MQIQEVVDRIAPVLGPALGAQLRERVFEPVYTMPSPDVVVWWPRIELVKADLSRDP